ncbi:MAG: hypothetical protein AAB480_02660 [Patescibacteria group bacterium]
MSEENFKGFIGGRHAERVTSIHTQEQVRAESEQYPAISEKGVDATRERSLDVKKTLEHAPKGTVFFFGGTSEEQRTKSTSDVYGDTLRSLYAGDKDTLVFTHREIDALHDEKRGVANTVRAIEVFIAQHPDKKVLIVYPLFLKEFSLRPDFRGKEAPYHLTRYSNALQPGGSAEHEAVEALMRSDGIEVAEDGSIALGPTALDVAKKYLVGIKRLREFAQEYAPSRPVMVGFVSHGLILDALTSYLANQGAPNVAAFKETGGKMIQSSEIGTVTIENGEATFEYHDKKYHVNPVLLNA